MSRPSTLSTQQTLSLSGPWAIAFDAENVGVEQRWFDPESAVWEGADEIVLPASWNQDFGDDTPDVAWFSRVLPAMSDHSRKRWLRGDAVCTQLCAWFNGKPIGEHEGNWTPYQFELLDGRQSGRLVIRVDRIRPSPARKIGQRIEEQGHITKGFHDILSRQPAGLWQDIWVRETGPIAFEPCGVGVIAEANTGNVCVELRLAAIDFSMQVHVRVTDPDGKPAVESYATIEGSTHEVQLSVREPQKWSADSPHLYTVEVDLFDSSGEMSDTHHVRFGFREIITRGRTILLNGEPLFINGMLDWGHEPMLTSPAPPPDVVRDRFRKLRARGINCVCVCLWYPPQWFYDVADEVGMLIWQEHPVWKPPMRPELNVEYRRQFERFFRLDQNHPSVIIVSGSCEHECFEPELARWWWKRAREMLPERLLQVQTAFLDAVPVEQTDLYDEHTYENAGRWPEFLADVDQRLADEPAKPFVMGESILYNDWPDVERLLATLGDDRPWWVWDALDAAAEFEQKLSERFGHHVLERFRRHARAWHLAGRKRQTEMFRTSPSHAGLVQNSLRDVAACPLGFMDDFDRWRFESRDTRAWLTSSVLLMRTPDFLLGLTPGKLSLDVGLSHFGPQAKIDDGSVLITVNQDSQERPLAVKAIKGDVRWATVEFDLKNANAWTPVEVEALLPGVTTNRWRAWLVPEQTPLAGKIGCDVPSPEERQAGEELDFEERRYSSGWGLAIESWRVRPPWPDELLPDAAAFEAQPPSDADLLVVSSLSEPVLSALEAGASVIHLPSKRPGSIKTIVPTLWGQSPLIFNRGPLEEVPAEALLDLLDRDLHHRWIRSVPTGSWQWADLIEPLLGQVKTHDTRGTLLMVDDIFYTRVGRGRLLVNSLDAWTVAGRAIFHACCRWMMKPNISFTTREVPLELLRAHLRSGPVHKSASSREAEVVSQTSVE